jgi:hypothetical protein
VQGAITHHELREAGVLADADALSFFALNSPGYLRWFGPEQTARKVAWTLARMSDGARGWLRRIRLEEATGRLVDEVALTATTVAG